MTARAETKATFRRILSAWRLEQTPADDFAWSNAGELGTVRAVTAGGSDQILNEEAQIEHFMDEAVRLSVEKMRDGAGGPFGAVVVLDGEIVGRG